MHNPFARLKRREWALWGVSMAVVAVCNAVSGPEPVTLLATFTGATALIFLARGDVWGQILTVAFSLLYGWTSFRCRYWGEMITYLCMTLHMAVLAVVSWLRHPFQGDRGEVAIQRLTRRQIMQLLALTAVVTAAFWFILRALDTPNLVWSTLSIATSFLAAYLTFLRSSWYALAYAANDLVLIVLWTLMSLTDLAFLPMVANFAIFFLNDMYGFVSWRRREKTQQV